MTPLTFAILGNEAMAEKLASALGVERGTMTVRHSPDGELYMWAESAVEGWRAAIVCTLDRPDDKLIPLLLLAAAARENGATDIGLVAPHLIYTRQDSCFQPGGMVSARHFVARSSRGFDWLATVDPHLHRTTKLSQVYVIPMHHVHVVPAVAAWLRVHVTHSALMGPDEESSQWVADVTSRADASTVVLHKVRKGDRDAEVSAPDVERWRDHTPALVDDIVSTGHTTAETIGHLRRVGSAAPVCIVIYAVSSGNAVQGLESTGAELAVSCNTVVHPTNGIFVALDLASAARELMQDPGGVT